MRSVEHPDNSWGYDATGLALSFSLHFCLGSLTKRISTILFAVISLFAASNDTCISFESSEKVFYEIFLDDSRLTHIPLARY